MIETLQSYSNYQLQMFSLGNPSPISRLLSAFKNKLELTGHQVDIVAITEDDKNINVEINAKASPIIKEIQFEVILSNNVKKPERNKRKL